VRTGDVAIGAFCLAADRERAWSHEDLGVLATVARSTALAIENARLYAGVAHERVRIGQLAVWQHALLEGSRIITQGNDLPA
jgi:GAF domain-containing protein